MTRLEKFTKEPLSQTVFLSFPHNTLGCHTLRAEKGDFPPALGVKSSEWTAFCNSLHLPDCDIDPLMDLVKQKSKWQDKYNLLCRKFNDDTIERFVSALSFRRRSTEMTKNELKFVNIVNSDPDKYFSGSCNWYCSGQLRCMDVVNQTLIASVQGKKLSQICMIPVHKNDSWCTDLTGSLSLKPGHKTTVYEVVTKNGLVAARSRNNCIIYGINIHDEVLVAETCFQEHSEKPFVSLDLDPESSNHYCSLDVMGNLCYWDIGKKVKLLNYQMDKNQSGYFDNWKQAKFIPSSQNICLADRFKLQMTDLRDGNTTYLWNITKQDNVTFECENICSVLPSSISPNDIYLGTTHHILLVDIRKDFTIQQLWTHMMRSDPLYMEAVSFDNGELLIVGNQEQGEVELICNNDSNTSPYLLPHLKDSLRASNAAGHSLHPGVKKRLSYCLSGLTCLKNEISSGMTLLVQTSGGDIFSQQLNNYEYTSNGIKCWNHLVTKHKHKLYATNRLDMSHVYRIINNADTNDFSNFNGCDDTDAKSRDCWQITRDTMEGYQNMMAQRILSVWDIKHLKKKRVRATPAWKKRMQAWVDSTQ